LSELPEKIVQDRLCELTPLQREIYEKLVSRCSVAREQPKREETEKDDGNNKNDWISPLQTLHALRKLVDHPCLIADLLAKMDLKTQLQLADWNQMVSEKFTAIFLLLF
jgi:SNF2 family DNA or RNA helicase